MTLTTKKDGLVADSDGTHKLELSDIYIDSQQLLDDTMEDVEELNALWEEQDRGSGMDELVDFMKSLGYTMEGSGCSYNEENSLDRDITWAVFSAPSYGGGDWVHQCDWRSHECEGFEEELPDLVTVMSFGVGMYSPKFYVSQSDYSVPWDWSVEWWLVPVAGHDSAENEMFCNEVNDSGHFSRGYSSYPIGEIEKDERIILETLKWAPDEFAFEVTVHDPVESLTFKAWLIPGRPYMGE